MKTIKFLIILTLLFSIKIVYANCIIDGFQAECDIGLNQLAIDGNGDGILDNEQSYVITILDIKTNNYLTLTTNNCPIQLASSHNKTEFKDIEYNFPQGILYYELQCKESEVTIYFHGINQLTTDLTYQKYGPTIPGDLSTSTWYSLPNVTFNETTIYGKSVVTANFILKDGELGDDTGVDGRIVDPGGIAYNDDIDNVISFISKNFTASRKAEQATITINRNGLIGEFTVDYNIKGDSAIIGKDFQTVNGTLTWNNNERGDKTFTIPLLKDATIGSDIQLTLTNLTPSLEGSLLGIEQATLTITNDDILTTLIPPVILQSVPSIIDVAYVKNHIFTNDVAITTVGNISHSTFAAYVKNDGMIANSTFLETAIVVGGKLSGDIINKGIIQDINFVGASLTGGMLAGNNFNNSEVGGVIQNIQLVPQATLSNGKLGGTVIGEDCLIKDTQLEADANLIGCDLAGEIIGNASYPAQIGAATILPGTILANVKISPTVEFPDDVTFKTGVTLPHEPPIIEDFGLQPEEITTLDNERLQQLEPEIFNLFTTEEIAQIPADAFSAVDNEQLAEFTVEALAGITPEQFQNLAPEALIDLTSKNMAGFSDEIINQFTPKHLEMLNPVSFSHQNSRNLSKIITNLNSNIIDVTDIESLLPIDWSIDETGTLNAPIGAKLTVQYLSPSINVPNINTGIGLGGQGTTIKEGLTRSLANEDLSDFVISQQQADGVLIVEGTGKSAGINYSFIPDADNIIQVDTEKTPIGLSIGNGGFFHVTTPEGQQYKVIPAPYDFTGLAKVLVDEPIVIGKLGDVLMQIPEQTRDNHNYYVAIFDPFIEPAPEDWCLETDSGETICDFDNAPATVQPGIHLPRERARFEPEKIKVVYETGNSQTCTPTVYSPETFIKEGLKFPGVEKLTFNVNGTFYVLHEGNSYIISPTFTVKTIRTTSNANVNIAVNNAGNLNYSIPVALPDKTRSNSQMIFMFDLFIEPAPDDWCIEADDGAIFCDFDNVPEF